ncbi:hypothetical protein D3C73_631270 [compost metagenome]
MNKSVLPARSCTMTNEVTAFHRIQLPIDIIPNMTSAWSGPEFLSFRITPSSPINRRIPKIILSKFHDNHTRDHHADPNELRNLHLLLRHTEPAINIDQEGQEQLSD